ncbi:MAG: sulfatase [Candidatus Binatia bacterium]
MSCNRDPPGPGAHTPAPPSFNVLLIVLDACRADTLGCYGYERATSPNLDAFAQDPDAVIFRRHYVQGSWTKPSTASLFTGEFLHRHGAFMPHKRHGKQAGEPLFTTQVLPGVSHTMAEYFRGAGFATFGVVKSWHLADDYGFAQGFDTYISPKDVRGDARRVKRFLRLVAATRAQKFFGYLHLNACHNPFPPDERDAAYMRKYGFQYDEAARRAAGINFTTAAVKNAINEGKLQLSAADVRFLHLIYEAKLRRTGQRLVGPLIEGLRKAGVYDDSLVIITADHGEELYDHGGYAHGRALWEEVIHVPLIVKFPKGHRPRAVARQVDALTSTVDLLPSLMELVGVAFPPSLPGRPVFTGRFNDYALVEQAGEGASMHKWALLQGDYKLIETAHSPLLFNLGKDPGERENLISREPQRLLAMRTFAHDVLGAGTRPAAAPVVDTALSPEARERLRSLGYLDANR